MKHLKLFTESVETSKRLSVDMVKNFIMNGISKY